MLNNKTVAVVVPAYNEEKQIRSVIETIPDFVDRVVIVDDCSKDATVEIVLETIPEEAGPGMLIRERSYEYSDDKFKTADNVLIDIMKKEAENLSGSGVLNKNDVDHSRIILIKHKRNQGVGRAIATGYKWCKDHKIDCTAVMAGDGQMDPAELESICAPVVYEGIGYVKGNRLKHKSASSVIPVVRFLGNSVLSILTKIASGYWHVSDTQTGYTAISLDILESIRIDKIYKSYGMPNDMLVKLNINYCTIKEVPIKPVYNVGEKSKMKVAAIIPQISLLLVVLFFRRLWVKYLFRDFHPLFLLYHFALLLFLFDLHYSYYIFVYVITPGVKTPYQILLIFIFLSISSLQSVLFAMWMDFGDNERLHKV